MQLTPEIKKQLEEQKKQCVFCKLISGEMEAKKVFEDDKTVAMLDIYPAIKGHTLFMPKEHYPILPYLPPEEFKHFFGLIPQLSKALKEAMVSTGINILIASGGAAGQQSPHFLMHLFPREEGDSFFNFFLKEKEILEEDKVKIMEHNFPLMMQNHFQRNPANWHKGEGERPDFLKGLIERGTVLYEDEKVLCLLPQEGFVKGHLEIYSKVEESLIENLSEDDSAHLFFTASLAATLVFEGLKVQGTNTILKSGTSDDNLNGKLCVHILPRMQDDGLNKTLLWQPKQPAYDLNSIAEKIKDKAWKIKCNEKSKEIESKEENKQESKQELMEEDITEPKVVKLSEEKEIEPENGEDEIMKAVERVKR